MNVKLRHFEIVVHPALGRPSIKRARNDVMPPVAWSALVAVTETDELAKLSRRDSDELVPIEMPDDDAAALRDQVRRPAHRGAINICGAIDIRRETSRVENADRRVDVVVRVGRGSHGVTAATSAATAPVTRARSSYVVANTVFGVPAAAQMTSNVDTCVSISVRNGCG